MSENVQGTTDSNGSVAGFIPSDEKPIFITARALEAMRAVLKSEGEAEEGLRVSVVGGGCSGYQYNLDFEKEERPDDTVMEFDGLKVLVDSVSVDYLKGTIVDYVSSLQGQGFKFENPNAKRTCGCGASFS
jgi:iron-sulfur cluster assembly protein